MRPVERAWKSGQVVTSQPGLETWASPDDDFWVYYDENDLSTLPNVLRQMDHYVSMQGPFDAIMGFSAGAVLAGLYLLDKEHRKEPMPFRCAVFFSAGPSGPALQSLQLENAAELQELIQIPTAHIYGANDGVTTTGGPDLSLLCNPNRRLTFIHDGGHEIPRKSSVTESTHIIRRIVALASED